MDNFSYADLTNVQIIYAVHKKNKRKVVETFVDFMAYTSLRLYSYKILLIRKATDKDIKVLRDIDERDKERGFHDTRFNRRFWCHSYKSLNQLIEEDKDLVDETMLQKIIAATKDEFLKLHKNQLEFIF